MRIGTTLSGIRNNIRLFRNCPKDFLYTVRYSDKKPVKIYPYDPKTFTYAKKLMNEIRTECGEIRLHLIGSTGLRIDGQKDIDLYGTSPEDKISGLVPKITGKFGKPSRKKKNYAEWYFTHKDSTVHLVLTTPKDERFLKQMRLFYLLKSNNTYLKEYEKLKNDLNGCCEKEYARKRMEFFNRIMNTGEKGRHL